MPRAKYPPTPGTSTGPAGQDKQIYLESAFILPPAAMNRSPPTSPVRQRKRTLSGSAKNKEDLPPPPSRARKIIQMKPKEGQSAEAVSSSTKATPPKRKQPTTSSAAGRKIARKTAHSIIERRRRSKMNEEFGVLKDMIPACSGVEMHKLAILQAGIEYVKYLQSCVDKLQDNRRQNWRPKQNGEAAEDDDGVDDEEEEEQAQESEKPGKTSSASPRHDTKQQEYYDYRRSSVATQSTATASTRPSPALLPNASSSSMTSERHLPPPSLGTTKTYSTSPPPLTAHTPIQTGVSPAFQAIHFSPDISRTYSHQQYPGSHSPNILPLPKAAMSMNIPLARASEDKAEDVQAEATATAALMMLTQDRRNSISGTRRSGGMSVRDLLSH